MTPEESIGPAAAALAVAAAVSKTNPLAALIKIVADRFTVIPPLPGMRKTGDTSGPFAPPTRSCECMFTSPAVDPDITPQPKQ